MAAIRLYDARMAPVALFEWPFDAASMVPICPPIRALTGHLMEAPVRSEGLGGQAAIEAVIATAAWALTRSLSLRRSDEALRARAPADGFREFAHLSGAIDVAWGEQIARAPGTGGLLDPGSFDPRFVTP